MMTVGMLSLALTVPVSATALHAPLAVAGLVAMPAPFSGALALAAAAAMDGATEGAMP